MGRPPEKLFDRIIYWLGVYAAIALFDIITAYNRFCAWIVEKLKPKHRHLNWLRKLSGIPEK